MIKCNGVSNGALDDTDTQGHVQNIKELKEQLSVIPHTIGNIRLKQRLEIKISFHDHAINRYRDRLKNPTDLISNLQARILAQRICQTCKVAKLQDSLLSKLVCPKCGESNVLFASSGGSSYLDESESNSHVYARKKNYRASLMSFCDSMPSIPHADIIDIESEWKKNYIRASIAIKKSETISVLKAHTRFAKYRKHAVKITKIINGQPVPVFTQDEIDILVNLFELIQCAYLELRESIRDPRGMINSSLKLSCKQSNFFNMSFVTRKLCEILEWTEIENCFPMNKDAVIIAQRDAAWRYVVQHPSVNLPFYSSF